MSAKVYLLWYKDWELNTVLGIFESKKMAENWREYLIMYPHNDWYCFMRSGDDIEAQHDREDRLEIEEMEIGLLHPDIKIDNLKYLELKNETKKNV